MVFPRGSSHVCLIYQHTYIILVTDEPLHEKTNHVVSEQVRQNRAVQAQKKPRSLKSYSRRGIVLCVAETKALISCAVTAQLILTFVFTYACLCFYCPPPFRRKAEGHSFWLSVLPSVLPSPYRSVCTLCAQLLLQFYSDSFETLQMSSSCFGDVHVVWI